jgi:methyl-accepting chemotaxis protein
LWASAYKNARQQKGDAMKMTISKKLYIGIGALTIALAMLGVLSRLSINATESGLSVIDGNSRIEAILAERIIDHYKWADALGTGTLLLGKEFKAQLDHTKCKFGEWYYGYRPPKDMEAEYKGIEEPHRRLHETAHKILAALQEKRPDIAKKIYQEETVPALASVQEAINKFGAGLKRQSEAKMSEIKSAQDRIKNLTAFVYAGIIAVIVIGSVMAMIRPLRKNLSDISEWIEGIAAGDLTKKPAIRSNDEIGDMASGLGRTIDGIRHVIGRTRDASHRVSAAADQIAEANQNFSQRITEQASSIEETSATMEEMSASIKQTAENAKEANKLAQSAKASAKAGISVMEDTIIAMDDINKSSGRIANISNVIEEIAFQTNLLALNAAVEAARAGEHGKGFAVVASEIRNLAQRTAASAKEITGLIEDSSGKTARGVQLAHDLNKRLEEIETGVKKVADLMDEVAAAASEQAVGINQVNTAMTQIDQTTQHNASIIEETSALAVELAARAKELMKIVSFFKSGEEAASEISYESKNMRPENFQTTEPGSSRQSYSSEKIFRQAEPAAAKHNGGFEEF